MRSRRRSTARPAVRGGRDAWEEAVPLPVSPSESQTTNAEWQAIETTIPGNRRAADKPHQTMRLQQIERPDARPRRRLAAGGTSTAALQFAGTLDLAIHQRERQAWEAAVREHRDQRDEHTVPREDDDPDVFPPLAILSSSTKTSTLVPPLRRCKYDLTVACTEATP